MRVDGIVQGVGFRPFVYQLATSCDLVGHVGNDAAGVFVEVEGRRSDLVEFTDRLLTESPPLARVDRLRTEPIAPRRDEGFVIVPSQPAAGARTLVPPDVATCERCLAEVDDPADRRYRYPFTNCTNCGPRFTIICELPYDRSTTTMAGFEMCPLCAAEYEDPADRRYHAQPNACPQCGPRVAFERGDDHVTGTDAVLEAVHRSLAAGEIVAIKGLGGYHLACDARSDKAVGRLRVRKGRADKPFAVMAPDLAGVESVAVIAPDEADVLAGPARPIVLLHRRVDASVSTLVAPGNPLLGVMLPSTPLHHLLFARVPGADVAPPELIVLTSGNRSDEPICVDDDDARSRLADLADAFCVHDRPIEVPCDDSVVRVVGGELLPIRRSRGFAPIPVELPVEVEPVIAAGGELKNTCCVAAGRHAWVGQHVGDMENLETLDAFEASVAAFCRMYAVDPIAYATDLHPAYLTHRWALERCRGDGAPVLVGVQHHHAHVASVMAEHGLDGSERVLGFAFDGTGYGIGPDGTVQIWGGEVLRADYRTAERVAHLAPMPLPGGDAGVRAPCRIAVAWLTELGLAVDADLPAVAACDEIERTVVAQQVRRGVGCVPTTSMGRLFDVVSSLLGVRHRIDYEGQAAIELEALATTGASGACRLEFGLDRCDGAAVVIDQRPVLAGVIDGLRTGAATADLALAFHDAVADVIAALVGRLGGGGTVALTGGVFQNALLTSSVRERLADASVITHRVVPPNDGGLALGQAVIAGVAVQRGGE